MYHSAQLRRASQLGVWSIVLVMLLSTVFFCLTMSSSMPRFVALSFLVVVGLTAAFVVAITHESRKDQTHWRDNYTTRLLLDVETVRRRSEAALERAHLLHLTQHKPKITGYCDGSEYVLWLQIGEVGLWIQRMETSSITRLVLGPKTEKNQAMVEAARHAVSAEFNIPE